MTAHAHTTVVRAGLVWTGGQEPELRGRTDILIEDGVVVALEPTYTGRADVEVDAEGCLVVPGLVNCHTHAGCSPQGRGISEDLDLPEAGAFYHSLIPLLGLCYTEATPEEFLALMEWDAIAMLRGGATTVCEENFGGAELWLDIVDRLGFRSNIGLTYPGNVSAIGYVKNGQIVRDAYDVAAGFEAGLAFHDAHHGASGDRLRVHLSPHASDTVPEDVLRATKRAAAERGITIHLHLAQHLDEDRTIRAAHGVSPVQYLEQIGFLGPEVLATHVTYTDADDWAAFARTGANVVHTAYRKAKEGLTSPLWEYLERGVNVCMATDSFSHDLVENVKLSALFGKVREHAVGRPRAEHVMSCATHGAARALARPDLGRIGVGARGDLLCLDTTDPFVAPLFDPLRNVVYYANHSCVRHTLVDGRPVVSERRVVGTDETAVRARATAASQRLWALAQERGALPAGSQPFGL